MAPTESDPRLVNYRFTRDPLVRIQDAAKGGKAVANVFQGEWLKLLDPAIPKKGPVEVRYCGGKGFVEARSLTSEPMLEVFFIDVGQGDSILLQTPDNRRILIDGGPGGEAHQFIRNKYRLDEKENFIDLEAVIATHSDADHTAGLIPILNDPKIGVRRFFHNGLFPGLLRRDKGRVRGLTDRPSGGELPRLSALMKKLVAAFDSAAAGRFLQIVAAL